MERRDAKAAGDIDGQLIGWASIGGYIGRDARTAQRYEVERGLPVRRMPGAGRSTVFALRADLEVWLHGPDAVQAALPDLPPRPGSDGVDDGDPVDRTSRPLGRPAPRRRVGGWAIGTAVGVCCGTAMALLGLWMANDPLAAARREAPQGPFDQRAAAALAARSPEGLTHAIDDYTQAVVRDPKDATAYAGLADSYNLAPEVTGMAPADAYTRARAAAERALALDPRSVQALRAMAFVDFWWLQKREQALGEFKRALALQPASAQTLHWYANALAARRDARALGMIDQALSLSPSPGMLTDKGWILLMLGRDAEARNLLEDLVQTSPSTARMHELLSTALLRTGDADLALREARAAADLRHDGGEILVEDAARKGLDAGGLSGMARATAATRLRLAVDGRASPFLAAVAASQVHQRQATLDMLRRAQQAHAPDMASLDVNPDFAWLHGDAEFHAIAAPR